MTGNAHWLSTAQVAEELGVVVATVYSLLNRGAIRAYRFGRVIRIKRVDLDEYIKANRIEPGDLEHLDNARRLLG